MADNAEITIGLLDEIADALIDNFTRFERECRKLDPADVGAYFALRYAQNDALAELVQRSRRSLDYMTGQPVAPQVQFGQAVLKPNFGDAA